MKKIILFILLSYGYVPTILAQCPPGQIMQGEQSGPGWQAPICIPSGNSTDAAPPPPTIWKDQWGAIAHDLNIPSAGVSENEPSKPQAERDAINNCIDHGGINCHISLTYDNECAAVAQKIGGGGISSNAAPTKKVAESNAIRDCEKYTNAKCGLKYSACSLPIRIQ